VCVCGDIGIFIRGYRVTMTKPIDLTPMCLILFNFLLFSCGFFDLVITVRNACETVLLVCVDM
jgi:hypothetical protein